jgi:hypothetical protein
MAITTIAALQNGICQEVPFKFIPLNIEAANFLYECAWNSGSANNLPISSAYGANGAAGTSLVSNASVTTPGYLPIPATETGQRLYLAGIQGMQRGQRGTVIVIDRLWHSQDTAIVMATTTAQTINSNIFPVRDLDNSANGRGVFLGIEVSAADTGNAANVTTITCTYVNSAGDLDRTATLNLFPATCRRSWFGMFTLQDGDLGVRSVNTVTLGTSLGATGNVSLVAFRMITLLPIEAQRDIERNDAITIGLPKLANGTCLNLLYLPNSATVAQVVGSITYAMG